MKGVKQGRVQAECALSDAMPCHAMPCQAMPCMAFWFPIICTHAAVSQQGCPTAISSCHTATTINAFQHLAAAMPCRVGRNPGLNS